MLRSKIYNALSAEEASVLAQCRTGHSRLRSDLYWIKVVGSAGCECGAARETIKHVIYECPLLREDRKTAIDTIGHRWRDLSYILGGWNPWEDPRTGQPVDEPRDKWKADLPGATASSGTSSKPKVLIIGNTFEFTYLAGLNFTTSYTGPLLTSLYACTETGEICKLECGQELVSAQITALALVPGIDLTATYVIITGTGGVNPKYGTAGSVAISQYSIQLEWLSMFLGSDLPANFSSQYMYAYAQASPFEYLSLVGSEIYQLNTALVDRIAAISTDLEFEDVDSDLQRPRQTYLFEAARKAPFLAHCDVVSSQIYWHGDVAGHNVEVYANIVTSGAAKPCNTNQDDQGRLLGLAGAAEAGLLDFSRVAMIKAFSNFDRPPPQLSAYQSRYYVGEAATGPGLRNAWSVIRGIVADVLEHWEDVYEDGISAPNYVGDAKGTLGGTPPFVQNSTAVAGSVQGA